jgi:hypothetical protein
VAGALVQALLAVHAEAEAAGHGRKGQIYEAAGQRLGMSRATLHKRIGEITMRKSRKQRSDAGRYTLPADEARIISGYLMAHYRANDKKLSSVEETLTVLRSNGQVAAGRVDEETGEFTPLSVSAVSRALRHYGLHPEQLRAPRAAQAQRSLHPNDVWQIDASISVLYYVPHVAGLADMSPAEYYKNKPGNFEKIKRHRLTRFVVTDHTSSAIFAWYVAGGESIAAFAETLLEAMREKPGECLYGVPFHLMMDPGSGATAVFKRLLKGLEITPVIHAPGNPRAKGQVEQANNIVETSFEAGFKMTHVPSVAWINAQARRWCAWYNANRVLRRTGKTRLAKWMEITQPQLRLADVELARQLLTREPEPAKVDTHLRVRFGGRVWDVSTIPDVQIGERLALTVNPLDPDRAYVVTMLDGQEALLPVPEVALGEHGFAADAALIGREIKRPADTRADTLRKQLERMTMEAATDTEAAAKRQAKALPFGGRIDPYKHLDDLPDVAVLPRRGTAHGPRADRVVEPPLSLVEAAQRLRARLGERWTPGHYQALGRRYPDGVPVAALDDLMQEWSGRAAGAVSGGAE